MDTEKEESIKNKVERLEMIESVYICTTFFISLFLLFLLGSTFDDISEIIRSGNIAYFYTEIMQIIFIYLIIITEIIGFIIIHRYNKKTKKSKK